MQLCDIELRLNGNVQHTVPKQNVTPAEIYVLRLIHGADSVVNIRKTRMDKRSHASEFERLRGIYGKAGHRSEDGQPTLSLEQIWPGPVKTLPVTLEQAGIYLGGSPAPANEEEEDGAQEAA